MSITKKRLLQLAAMARHQAVVSARVEGIIVPNESRYSEQDILDMARAQGIEVVDEDD